MGKIRVTLLGALAGLAFGSATAQESGTELCADFAGANASYNSPFIWQGFGFEPLPGRNIDIDQGIAIVSGRLTILPPIPVNGITVDLRSPGDSTTHDFRLTAIDGSGANVDQVTANLATSTTVQATLSGVGIVALEVTDTIGGMAYESGVTKVCIPVTIIAR
ncbi:hypothetical protein [Devosia sp.]|uniref:hypothetical protein n=1 Tax=Devosia sp. TaxID=1871048 RepID=UPI003A8D2B2E